MISWTIFVAPYYLFLYLCTQKKYILMPNGTV